MINKQSLWFVTLFSLIIILSIYYFSTDQTSLKVANFKNSSSYVASDTASTDNLSVLKVAEDESTIGKIDELENILLDSDATLEEKNNAYDELEVIGNNKTKEEDIKRKIKDEFDLNSFVKITDNHISVVVSSSVSNNELANNIIRKVQEDFDENKYVTVKFDSN